MKLELTLEQLPEVTQPLPEHKTDQSGQSQDAHEDNLPGNTEHEKSANAEEHQDEKATTEDEKSEEVGNDDVADTTKEEELKWTELLLDDDYDFETAIDKSPSQQEWSRQKREENQQNVYLDRIMSMVGHEQVKAHFLAVKEKVDTAKRWNRSIKDWTFDLLIHGRNGTGKNMIAQIYTEFLHSIGVVDKKKFAVENKWYKNKITPEVSILFFWDADRIDRESEVDDILEAIKGSNSRTVLILSFRKLDPDTQKALDTSSESRRRFSNIIRHENYGESEIFELLTRLCKSKPEFGDGSTTMLRTLSQKIAGRALAEGRAFTNAHAVAEEVDKVCERYQKRKEAAWMAWAKTHSPDDGKTFGPEHFKDGISLEDVLGIHNCYSLGPPGVGKTTVAALYAKILTELGLLSKGHVITKKASDLIGRYRGHSEGDTAEALQDAKGGVLIIDDAHLLYQERADGSNDPDDFRQGVIDTLVANISGSPGEDRCLILCGYEDRMKRMFLRSNPGLGRRFPLENACRFTSYDDDELGQILKQKMENEDLVITDGAFNAESYATKTKFRKWRRCRDPFEPSHPSQDQEAEELDVPIFDIDCPAPGTY
ncbi:Protein CfxQ-like protein [Fusarium oxysporum f. sp. conglutinans]|nr:Protein CfxQ-like protein [Fusarium oxysporum f. sp. conglutinans]